LAGGFTRPVEVKDRPGVSRSLHQPCGLLVVGQWASEQIIEKERPQSFDRFLPQRR
jgi:hypothetical protein